MGGHILPLHRSILWARDLLQWWVLEWDCMQLRPVLSPHLCAMLGLVDWWLSLLVAQDARGLGCRWFESAHMAVGYPLGCLLPKWPPVAHVAVHCWERRVLRKKGAEKGVWCWHPLDTQRSCIKARAPALEWCTCTCACACTCTGVAHLHLHPRGAPQDPITCCSWQVLANPCIVSVGCTGAGPARQVLPLCSQQPGLRHGWQACHISSLALHPWPQISCCTNNRLFWNARSRLKHQFRKDSVQRHSFHAKSPSSLPATFPRAVICLGRRAPNPPPHPWPAQASGWRCWAAASCSNRSWTKTRRTPRTTRRGRLGWAWSAWPWCCLTCPTSACSGPGTSASCASSRCGSGALCCGAPPDAYQPRMFPALILSACVCACVWVCACVPVCLCVRRSASSGPGISCSSRCLCVTHPHSSFPDTQHILHMCMRAHPCRQQGHMLPNTAI